MSYDLQGFYRELDRLFQSGNAETLERFMLEAQLEAERQGDEAALIGIRNELGGLYRAGGRIDEAHALYDQVLAALRKSGLEASAHYATAEINLGDVYLAERRYDDALAAFLSAKEKLTQLGLAADYRMAALENNISVAYASKGAFDEAARALAGALAIIGDNPDLAAERATTQVNLAQLKIRTGAFPEAKALLEEALAIYGRLGRDPHEGQAWQGLAQVAYFSGDYQGAVAAYDRAMDALRRDFGPNHPILAELATAKDQALRLLEGRL